MNPASFVKYIEGLGNAGPVLFVLGYALACVALVPGSLLTLAAGVMFGLAKGTILVFTGAMIGSAASFLIARYAARRLVERRLGGNSRFGAIDRAIGEQGRRIVFLLRLSPLIPFSALNYALGLTRVTFRDYLIAGVGMLPGTVLYVYYGSLAGDIAAVASGVQRRGVGYYSVLVVGLVATVLATTIIARAARASLQSATGNLASNP